MPRNDYSCDTSAIKSTVCTKIGHFHKAEIDFNKLFLATQFSGFPIRYAIKAFRQIGFQRVAASLLPRSSVSPTT